MSYWLGGLVVSVLLPAIGLLVVTLLQNQDQRREFELFLGMRGFVIAGQIWLAVGIWRAASRHAARGGRRRWAFLAKLVVAVGVLCAAAEFASAAIPEAAELYALSGTIR